MTRAVFSLRAGQTCWSNPVSDLPPPGPPVRPPVPAQPVPQQPPTGWLRLTLQGNAATTILTTSAVTVTATG
jgi:hypothetical protein